MGSIKKHTKNEVKEHYRKIASEYASDFNLYCQKRFISLINSYLGKGQPVLDIGCGNGYIMGNLKANSVIGIDQCFEMLAQGNNKNFLCADAENLPFPKDSFDAVYSVDLLEHIPNPDIMVKESSRVLKDNGKLIIITPNGDLGWFLEILDRLKLKTPEGPHKFLRFNELRRLLENGNFNAIKHEKFLFFPKDLPLITKITEKSEKYMKPLCLFQLIVGIKE